MKTSCKSLSSNAWTMAFPSRRVLTKRRFRRPWKAIVQSRVLNTRSRQMVWLLLWSLLNGLLIARGAGAEDEQDSITENDPWAVQAAREGLRESDNYPWYDAAEDDLRQLEFEPPTPPPEARDWELNLPQWQSQQQNWNWNISFWEGVQWVVWVLLVIFLVGSLGLLIRVIWQRDRFSGGISAAMRQESLAREAEQIENLPFPVERPQTDLLGAARQHYELGNYGEAIVFLFSYQLVHLDKHQLIRLAKGKTNRQYLHELRDRQGLRGMLRQTMIAFEDFFFGDHAIEKNRFETCWRHLDDFHKTVQQLMPSAG